MTFREKTRKILFLVLSVLLVAGAASFAAGLSLTKITLNSSVEEGDIYEFEINLTNNDTQNYSNLTLLDLYNHTYLNYSSASVMPNGTNLSAGELVWYVPSLTVNSSLVLRVNFTAIFSGTSTTGNTVEVVNSTNATLISVDVPINVTADFEINISVLKTSLNGVTFDINDTIQFQINVTNNADNATNITLFDNFNASFINFTSANPAPDYVNTTDGEVNWNFNITDNQSLIFLVNFTVTGSGMYQNTVVVEDSEMDPIANDGFNVTLNAPPGSILIDIDSMPESPINLGDLITYEINVTNTDLMTAVNNLTLFLDYNSSIINATGANPQPNSTNATEGSAEWFIDLAANQTLTFVVNFTGEGAGNTSVVVDIENASMAIVSTDNDTLEVVNNSALVNVSAEKTSLNGVSFDVNDTIEFQLNVTNFGDNLTNITVIDFFNASFINFTTSDVMTDYLNTTDGQAAWSMNLSTNESFVVRVNFTVTGVGVFENSLVVEDEMMSSIAGAGLNVTLNGPAPGVSISMVSNPSPTINLGDTISYQINVTNGDVMTALNNLTLFLDYNSSIANYTGGSPLANSTNLTEGEVEWYFDLAANQTLSFIANFTGEAIGNTTIIADVENGSMTLLASSNDTLDVQNNSVMSFFVTKSGPGSANVNETVSFVLNVTNNEMMQNFTNLTLWDYFDPGFLNFTNADPSPTLGNASNGTIGWYFNLSNGSSYVVEVNYTVLTNGSTSNGINLTNSSNESLATAQVMISLNVNMTGGDNMSGSEGNYTNVWSLAQPAQFLTAAPGIFGFAGAPYVARGDGCYREPQYADNYNTPGENCCSDKDFNGGDSCNSNGKVQYDLGAVWVEQVDDLMAWKIAGAYTKSPNNLSVCSGDNQSAAYVVEFDIDDNQSTGCNWMNESCYPGADYQIWFFPDENETLFAYYNETDQDGVSFAANTTISSDHMWVYYDCNATDNKDRGITIIINSTEAFGAFTPQLNFETNSFNTTEAITNPIDLLTDFGGGSDFDAFLVTGPAPEEGACFTYDHTNASACVNNSDGFSCVWTDLGDGGLCDPDFNSFSAGASCFQLTSSGTCNDNANNGLGYCRWESEVMQPNGSVGLCVEEFNPFEFGNGDCDSDCFNCFTDDQCAASDANGGQEWGGCFWYTDDLNTNGWCDVKGLLKNDTTLCGVDPSYCYTQADCSGSGFFWNATVRACLPTSGAELCTNGIDDDGDSDVDCDDSSCAKELACGGNVNTLTGTYKGFETYDALLQQLTIGQGPILFLDEDLPSDGNTPADEILGFAIAVSDLGLGMGIGVENSSTLLNCPAGTEDNTFLYMIDTDANVSTGCNITINGAPQEGYERYVRYGDFSTVNLSGQVRQMYACINDSWAYKDSNLISPHGGDPNVPEEESLAGECQRDEIAGSYFAVVMLDKASIGNPTEDVRFGAAVVNETWVNETNVTAADTMYDIYYTPGTVDFEPIDCFEEPTKCGSEFMILGGGEYMPLEDCLSPGDEDADGAENCQDLDCSFAPQCVGQFNLSDDKTRPKVKLSKVDTFHDAAVVRWVTNEPTNGTVNYYYNDSSCGVLNTSIFDSGDPATTADDYRPWHDVFVGDSSIGSPLNTNATYYYKTVSVDPAGNTATSGCLNFTTEAAPENFTLQFDFTPAGAQTSHLGNFTIEINGTNVTPGSSFELDGAQSFIDINMTFRNPDADPGNDWEITLEGVDLSVDSLFDLDGGFVAENTTDSNDIVGMDHSSWLNLVQKLGADGIVVKIPEPGATLLHCSDNGTNCTDVTDQEGVELLESGAEYTVWKVPTTIGFSTYSTGSQNITLNYSNITNADLSANVDVNASVLILANNTFTQNETYNFTLDLPTNLTGWINGSTTLDNITLVENGTVTLNITVQGNSTGTYVINIVAMRANDSSVTLNSTQDLNITLTVTTPADTTDPVAAISSPADNTNTSDTTPQITFTLTDDTSATINYTVYVDGATNGQNASATNGTATNLNLSTLSEGTHSVIIEALDNANNTGNSSALTITVDTSAPTVTINSPANATNTSDSTPELNFTLADFFSTLINYTIYVDGSANGQVGQVANDTATVISVSSLGDGNHNITVEGEDLAGNKANATVTITVDTTEPTISGENATEVNSSSAAIIWTTNEVANSSVNYGTTTSLGTTAGAASYVTAHNVSVSGLSASTTYYYNVTSCDVLGNCNVTGPHNFTTTAGPDTVDPTATISSPANGTNTSDNTPQITFTLSDDVASTINYTIYVDGSANGQNGSATNGTATNLNVSALADGTHLIVVEATDNSSNKANSSALTLTVDTSAPTVTINSPVNASNTSDSTPELNFTLSDVLSSLINYTVYVDGSANGQAGQVANDTATVISVSSLADGNHNITVEGEDLLGNKANSSVLTITVDTTAPVITAENATEIANSSAAIVWTTNEIANSSVNYGTTTSLGTTAGAASYVTAHNVSVSGLSASTTYYYNVTSCDVVGNCNTTGPYNFTTSDGPDTTNPTAVISSPADNTNTSDTTPQITFTLTDNVATAINYTVFVDGSANGQTGQVANGSATNLNVSALSEGTHSVIIEALDNASNKVNSSALTLTVDTSAPTVTINTPANASTTSDTTPELNFTLADFFSTLINYTVYVDDVATGQVGQVANDTATVLNLSALGDGNHNITVEGEDLVGNKANTTVTITVDTTAPVITAENATEINASAAAIVWTTNEAANSSVDYGTTTSLGSSVVNTSTTTSHNVSVTGLTAATTYYYNVTSCDALDNCNTTGPYNFTTADGPDTTNPTAVISSPANATNTSDSTPQITFTLTDNVATTINYTIYVDGSANGQNGSVSNGSATNLNVSALADGTHLIVVEATDNSSNKANSSALTLTVDTSAPTVTINSPVNATNTSDSTPELNFTLSDVLSSLINYTIYVDGSANGQAGQVANDTATVISVSSLADGAHTIVVEGEDLVGNKANSTSLTITVDTTAPVITAENATEIANSSAAIVWTTNEVANSSVNYGTTTSLGTTTGNASSVTSHNVSISGLASNTTYYYNVTSCDVVGNCNTTGPYNFTTTETADTFLPVLSGISAAGITNETARITWTADEGVNGSVNYGENTSLGSSATNTSFSVSQNVYLSSLAAGTMYFYNVTACDNDGNCNTSGPYNFTTSSNPDGEDPVANITSPANNTNTTDTTPQISFTLTDGTSTTINYTIYVDGSANGQTGSAANGSSTNLNLSTLAEGTHSVIVQATDNSSNSGNSTALTITVDTSAPTVTITSPANASTTSDNTTQITFTVNDTYSTTINYTVFIDDGYSGLNGSTTDGSTVSVNTSVLADGNHNITVEGRDALGNAVNSTQVTITVDTLAPVTTDDAPSGWQNSSFNVTLTPTDVLSSVNYTSYSVDGGALQNGTTVTISTNGNHTITYYSVYSAGNVESNKTAYAALDASNPAAVFLSPSNASSTADDPVAFSFNLTDSFDSVLNYTLYVDGTANVSGTGTNASNTTVNVSGLTEAIHTFIVEVTDEADNKVNSSTLTVTVDRTAPVTTITSPANTSYVAGSNVSMVVTVVDALDSAPTYTVYVNGTANETGTASNSSSTTITVSGLSETSYVFIIEMTDAAGNSANSTSRLYTFDATSPDLNVTNPADNATISQANTTINWTINDTNFANVTINVDFGDLVVTSTTASDYINVTNLTAGTHSFTVIARDLAGQTDVITQTFLVDIPLNASAFIADLNTSAGITELELLDASNSSINYTSNGSVNLSGAMFTLQFNATDAVGGGSDVIVALSNFSATSANYGATFTVLTQDNDTNESVVDLGSTPVSLISLQNVSNFLNDSDYFGRLVFNVSGLSYTYIYYCEDGGVDCQQLSQCTGNNESAFNGTTGCFTNTSSEVVVIIPGFSSVVLSLDNIVGSLNVTSPDNSTPLLEGSAELLNFTASEAVTANLTLYLNGSIIQNSTLIDTLATTFSAALNGTLAENVLANGNYTVQLDVRDSSNNNDTVNFTFIVNDTTGPNLTSAAASSITTTTATIGVSTDEYTNITVFYGTSSTALTSNSSQNAFSLSPSVGLTGLTAGTLYYYNITGVDVRGLSTTIGTSSFTTTAASTSGGSSGGGGGGGSSGGGGGGYTSTPSSEYTTVIPFANPEAANVIRISRDAIPVTEVSIRVNENVQNMRLAVTALDGAPADVGQFTGNVFSYLEITVSDSESVQSATIEFEVTTEWLNANGIDGSDVRLYRYRNNLWEELQTTVESRGPDGVVLSARTNGFSYFAIGVPGEPPVAEEVTGDVVVEEPVAEPVEEPPAETAEDVVEEIVEEAKSLWKNPFLYLLVILVIVMVSLVFVGLNKRKKKPPRDLHYWQQ